MAHRQSGIPVGICYDERLAKSNTHTVTRREPATFDSMPNSSSAKKSLRQNHRRRDRNRTQRSALRTLIKKCRSAIDAGDVAAAESAYQVAQKELDQAGAKRLIHPNAAARTKSRLSQAIKAAKGGSGDSA